MFANSHSHSHFTVQDFYFDLGNLKTHLTLLMPVVERDNMQMTLKSRILCYYIISFENVEKEDRNSVELDKLVTTFHVDLESKTITLAGCVFGTNGLHFSSGLIARMYQTERHRMYVYRQH